MGPTQSKRTLSTNEDATVASHAGEVPGSHRGFDSAPLDFEARRHRNASGGNRLSHSEDSTHMTSSMEVPDSVNQMLQASLGDEPGLNLMSMRHDSRAAELSQEHLKAGKNKLPTVFRWDSGGDEVYVAGTFSNWKRIPLVRSRDHFYTICELAEGEHEYKYIVDGAWRCDEKVETKVSGEHNLNNVIQVKQTDFEVFEALQCDNQQGTTTGHKDTTHRSSGDHQDVHASAQLGSRLGSPPGTYTQDIPSRRALELEPPPPTLPPHLLQVLLNKDTAANYDPNLLPEPNHVMLNHLYALSIRDGVMVLSATHRYRKKYVTTLLYKPIQ